MLRFARNEPALRLAGNEDDPPPRGRHGRLPARPSRMRTTQSSSTNMIVEQSKAWMMNRYFRGSSPRVAVAARNADGAAWRDASRKYTFREREGENRREHQGCSFPTGLPQWGDPKTTSRPRAEPAARDDRDGIREQQIPAVTLFSLLWRKHGMDKRVRSDRSGSSPSDWERFGRGKLSEGVRTGCSMPPACTATRPSTSCVSRFASSLLAEKKRSTYVKVGHGTSECGKWFKMSCCSRTGIEPRIEAGGSIYGVRPRVRRPLPSDGGQHRERCVCLEVW